MSPSGFLRYIPLLQRILFFGTAFFIAPTITSASPHPIVLSEIQVSGEKSNDEFIELYNPENTTFDLSGMQLRRRTASGSESSIKVFPENSIVPAQGYFLWANSQGIYAKPFADSETSSSALADNNSVALFSQSGASGILIDSIAWGTGSPFAPETPLFPNPDKKQSFTRDITTLSWSTTTTLTPTNSNGGVWSESVPDPLPSSDPVSPPIPSPIAIRFNELLPNPIGDEVAGEFIEFYNKDTVTADLSGFIIRDASKTGKYVFPLNTSIAGKEYFILTRNTSKISLNNSNETISLFDAAGILIDSVYYDKTKEGVSLNYTEHGWQGGTPTPGAQNQLNTLPETKEKVPQKGYRGVPISFSARGKDADGDKLKYTWNFGDGHKSYKENTSHTYLKNDTYQVTLTTTDGSDDVIEIFSLKIESLPKPNVRITSLIPNPTGIDSDQEWLLLENRGKKSVDLKGFGIATGWKKLINHPIRGSFIIEPKSERKLTRIFSLFTLPNQKGKIELRMPDGKVLQKISYKLEKSIKEDIIYKKEKGKRWAWQETSTATPSDTKDQPESILPDIEQEEILEETEKEVLGATTNTDNAFNRNYLKLLNYGTAVQLPANIQLSFSEPAIKKTPVKREHYAVAFAKKFLASINAALNSAQNNTWKGQSL